MSQERGFSYLSKQLSINFFNTLQMHQEGPFDLIPTEEEVHEWITFMNSHHILKTEQVASIASNGIDIEQVHAFRHFCRQYFRENKEREEEKFLKHLSAINQKSPLYFCFLEKDIVAIPQKGGSDGLLSLLAFDLLQMHANGQIKKVKGCANEECLAFFVNQKGNRKWCSMEICGNRKKVKKHYYKNTK